MSEIVAAALKKGVGTKREKGKSILVASAGAPPEEVVLFTCKVLGWPRWVGKCLPPRCGC